MDINDWREYFVVRDLVEKAAQVAWPDAEIQWMYSENGLSIDASAYNWNPILSTQDALNLAMRLKNKEYIEIFQNMDDTNTAANIRRTFVEKVVSDTLVCNNN